MTELKNWMNSSKKAFMWFAFTTRLHGCSLIELSKLTETKMFKEISE